MTTINKLLLNDKELRDVIELSNDGIEVISLLNHFNIDPMIFIGNVEFLRTNGMVSISNIVSKLPTSKSIEKYRLRTNRPGNTPRWAMAAIPDVLEWFDEKLERSARTENHDEVIKAIGLNPNDITEEILQSTRNDKGHMNAATYRNLIYNYIRETNLSLETAAVKKSLNFVPWGCLSLIIFIVILLVVKIVF